MKTVKKLKFTFNIALLLILIVIFAAISILNPVFLSPEYLLNVVLRNVVELGLISLPMTLIIITGGIDLSVGNIMVLSAMVGAMAAGRMGSAAGVIVTFLVGLACGLFNGIIIAKVKVPAMVTTLASMFLFLGLTRGMTGGDSVYAFPAAEAVGSKLFLGIPVQIFIYMICAVLFYILLAKSTFGRRLFGIGLNRNATKYCGVDIEKMLIRIYALSGLMCALAALIMIGRFSSLRYDAGTNINLKVITIVVLGGTSILGGTGDLKGTILATLIIGVLNSGLTVLNIPIDTQTIVHGTILIISLIAYEIVNRRTSSKRLKEVKTELLKKTG